MKKLSYLLLVILLLILAAGCGSTQTQANMQSKENIVPVQKEPEQLKLKTAGEITNALKVKGLPISAIIVYNEETDVNKLLGRPNQYIGKANFADTTVEQIDLKDPCGGSVEFFRSADEAKARKDYIDNIGKNLPMAVEYSYINGTALLRLNKNLTPSQATKYEKIFKELKI